MPIVKSQGENSVVTDLELAFDPGNWSETYKATCERKPPDQYSPKPPPEVISPPPSTYWTSIYKVLHVNEVDASGRYSAPIAGVEAPAASPGAGMPPLPDLSDPAAVQAFVDQMQASMGQNPGGTSEGQMPTFMITANTMGGAFIARNWTISGGELFATLEWDHSDARLGVTETGTFKLFHRPG